MTESEFKQALVALFRKHATERTLNTTQAVLDLSAELMPQSVLDAYPPDIREAQKAEMLRQQTRMARRLSEVALSEQNESRTLYLTGRAVGPDATVVTVTLPVNPQGHTVVASTVNGVVETDPLLSKPRVDRYGLVPAGGGDPVVQVGTTVRAVIGAAQYQYVSTAGQYLSDLAGGLARTIEAANGGSGDPTFQASNPTGTLDLLCGELAHDLYQHFQHASSHLTGGSDPIPLATQQTAGLMSAADKTKLDNGGGGGGSEALVSVPFAFNTVSPLTILTAVGGELLELVRLSISLPMNGPASRLQVGTIAQPGIMLDVPGTLLGEFETDEFFTLQAGEIVRLTITPDGSTEGSGTLHYRSRS